MRARREIPVALGELAISFVVAAAGVAAARGAKIGLRSLLISLVVALMRVSVISSRACLRSGIFCLSTWPTRDPILAAYLLQRSSATVELLRDPRQWYVEVFSEILLRDVPTLERGVGSPW